MAASDYAEDKATAEEMIAEDGKDCVIRSFSTSGTAHAPTRSSVMDNVKAVELNQRIRDGSGTLTGQTLRTLLVSTAAGVTPKKGDQVAVGLTGSEVDSGTAWEEIGEVRALDPGGTVLLWECDLVG